MAPIPQHLNRYAQQVKLKEIGLNGQEKLIQASVLCVGAGGIGQSVLPYLAGAGIGTLGIIDDDCIEEGNLHRQILYQENEVGQAKALIAKMKVHALNSNIELHADAMRFNAKNAEELISQYDLVADCSDNFYTRYLVHDTCFRLNKPYVYASASQFQGHCSVFYGKNNPCLHCLFPLIPNQAPNCQDDGVIGTLPGLLGTIQATEIIKWITHSGVSLLNRLLCIDFLSMEMKTIHLLKNKDCAFCMQEKKSSFGLCTSSIDSESLTVSSHNLIQFLHENSQVLLLDVRTIEEHETKNLGGKLIPLNELPTRLHELDPKRPILIYCRSGQRSQHALMMLRQSGFRSVYHLDKGILSLDEAACLTLRRG